MTALLLAAVNGAQMKARVAPETKVHRYGLTLILTLTGNWHIPAANLLLRPVLAGKNQQRGLDDSTTKPQNQMQSRLCDRKDSGVDNRTGSNYV